MTRTVWCIYVAIEVLQKYFALEWGITNACCREKRKKFKNNNDKNSKKN